MSSLPPREPFTPPTNKWRVTVGAEEPKSFRSENKAYEFVREQLPHGHRIVVREWENGVWRLYEVFEARSDSSLSEEG